MTRIFNKVKGVFSQHNSKRNRQRNSQLSFLTGIPMQCSLLNKLMEIHTMQKSLPDVMLSKFITEMDERNIGGGSINASRIINLIEKSNKELKQAFVSRLSRNSNRPNVGLEYALDNITNSNSNTTELTPMLEIPIVSKEDGVWAHYWGNEMHPLPECFTFPKNKILCSLWQSWHIPDVINKNCPYRLLTRKHVAHTTQGYKKYQICELLSKF